MRMQGKTSGLADWLMIGMLAGLIAGAFRPARAQMRPPQFVTAVATIPGPVTPGKPFTVVVTLTVDKAYHIQANPPKQDYIPTVVTVGPLAGFVGGKALYPPAVQARVGGDTLPVFEGIVQIRTTVTPAKTVRPGKFVLPVTVSYQGCNDRTCYPPKKLQISAAGMVNLPKRIPAQKKTARNPGIGNGNENAGRATPGLTLAQATEPAPGAGDVISVPGFRASKITSFVAPAEFAKWLQSGQSQAGEADTVTRLLHSGGTLNFAGALGLIYLLGLALNLTPCVYPLIPITIGYFGRQAASGAKTGGLSICYAMGMASMYSLLGVFAALAGKVFGAQLNNPVVLVGFAILMFALGLSMFDRPDGRPIWELQLPSRLTGQAKSRTGYLGALLMGLMVGLVAAPCIGPVVVALIKVVGDTRSVQLGLVTFFTLGIGLATPYLLLGFGLIKALPRAGEWMVAVKHIFGLLLFGMSLYYLRGLMAPNVYRVVISLFAVGSGLYLLFLDKAGKAAIRFLRVKQVAGALAIALGIWLFLPKNGTETTTMGTTGAAKTAVVFETPKDYATFQARLQQAKAEHKEVIIDFWASWCAACKELDETTFHDPNVVRATDNFVALRFRLEDLEGGQAQPFVKNFNIVGLPTVVHLVPDDGSGRVARVGGSEHAGL